MKSKVVNMAQAVIRKRAFEEMTPEMQQVAKDVDEKLGKVERGTTLVSYDVGSLIRQVLTDDARYGAACCPGRHPRERKLC